MRLCCAQFLAAGIAAVCALRPLAAESPTIPPPPTKTHYVFAHYMTCFTLDVSFCKQEIRIAQAHGLDGFAMDFGEWCDGAGKPTRYVGNMDNMFEAAKQLGTDFKLLLTPEYSVQPVDLNVDHMVNRYYDHPNAMRYQGKFCLSSYGMGGGSYDRPLTKLKAEGKEIFFVPLSGVGRFEMSQSVENGLRLCQEPHVDGIWRFACDDSPWGLVNTNANLRRAAIRANKLYMAGIAPNYNSANVRDMQGLRGYGAVWEGIIRDNADWVEIVTWNDYNEDSNLMHYKWKRDWDKPLYNRDGAYLDATAYYVSWFKTGAAPRITQDKVFFAYRDRSRWLTKAWDADKKEWKVHTMGKWPFTQIHDDVLDKVYFSTFLTAPARLTVTVGGNSQSLDVPAGVRHGDVAMRPGVPRFLLQRDGKPLLDVVGRRSIIEKETEENSLDLPGHPHSRIWAGAAVAGPARRLDAKAAALTGGATIQAAAGKQAVFISTQPAASATWPLTGVQTWMHNIRFTYSNPNAYDRRLTLLSDGVERQDPDEKYRIPLWLPPTGKGKWAAATLMWTLYDKATYLKVECSCKPQPQPGQKPGPNDPKPGWNDAADIFIEAVDLVAIEPMTFTPPAPSLFPELVKIPGGAFTMGSKTSTEADEMPAHPVELSTFHIGKYEVTNAEFERFMPEHRQWRDGYSWRDREPVMYVDWRESARYCNWLSKQAGLPPVYDEKTWAADPKADGFRLPTEAEWEYVATGRGETREYPWGNVPPRPMLHGNFTGAAALDSPTSMRSQEPQGTVVVGSFPEGASRDGVMDLAGNVAEWCTDWYQLYTAEVKTDPLETRENHSRVIRGGSWGYYGYSQRARDREFNSPVYPGYIYVGLRVALPETGYRKLNSSLPAGTPTP
jgi:formylglycine-generating enzyme required for sulfatase activity